MFRLIKFGKGVQTHSVEPRPRKNKHFHTYCGKDLVTHSYEDVGDGVAPTCMNCRSFARVKIPQDHKIFGLKPNLAWLRRSAELEEVSADGS